MADWFATHAPTAAAPSGPPPSSEDWFASMAPENIPGKPVVRPWQPSPIPQPQAPVDAVTETARRLAEEQGGIAELSQAQEAVGADMRGPAEGIPQLARGLVAAARAPRDAAALRNTIGQSVELNQPGIAAGSDIIEGAMGIAEPAFVIGAVRAPLVTGAMVLSALAGEKAGRAATKAAGGSEEAQRFAGNLSALAAGAIGAKAPGAWKDVRLQNAVSAKQLQAALQELHVDRSAALKPDAIRAAFIARAKATHPDLHPNNPKAADQFAAAKQAYTYLIENPPHERLVDSWRAALSRGIEAWFGGGDAPVTDPRVETPGAAPRDTALLVEHRAPVATQPEAPMAPPAVPVAEPTPIAPAEMASPAALARQVDPVPAETVSVAPVAPADVPSPSAPPPEPVPVTDWFAGNAPDIALVAPTPDAPVQPVSAVVEGDDAPTPTPTTEAGAVNVASETEPAVDEPAVDVSGPINPIEQAKADWLSGRAYVDGNGNYHVREEGASRGTRGPIAPWNKAAKRAFATVEALHSAARGAADSVVTPSEPASIAGLLERRESEVRAGTLQNAGPSDSPGVSTDTAPSPETAPAIAITGDEIGKGIKDVAELRKAAVAYYEHELRGRLKFVERQGFGKVVFTRAGRNKTLSSSANSDTLRLLAAVPQIIVSGTYLGESAPAKARAKEAKAYHYFSAPVEIGGRRIEQVEVTVWEDMNGHKYYNVTAMPKKEGEARSEPAAQARGPEPPSASPEPRGQGATKDSIGPDTSPVKTGRAKKESK